LFCSQKQICVLSKKPSTGSGIGMGRSPNQEVNFSDPSASFFGMVIMDQWSVHCFLEVNLFFLVL